MYNVPTGGSDYGIGSVIDMSYGADFRGGTW